MMLKRKIALIFVLTIAAMSPAGVTAADTLTATEFGAKFVRVELYFGLRKPDGKSVTEGEWRAFLDTEVTPRFADGFTVIDAWGQFRGRDGTTIRVQSRVLVVMYPKSAKKKNGAMIDEIRAAYKKAYDQESVLRVDYTKHVEVDF